MRSKRAHYSSSLVSSSFTPLWKFALCISSYHMISTKSMSLANSQVLFNTFPFFTISPLYFSIDPFTLCNEVRKLFSDKSLPITITVFFRCYYAHNGLLPLLWQNGLLSEVPKRLWESGRVGRESQLVVRISWSNARARNTFSQYEALQVALFGIVFPEAESSGTTTCKFQTGKKVLVSARII